MHRLHFFISKVLSSGVPEEDIIPFGVYGESLAETTYAEELTEEIEGESLPDTIYGQNLD